MTCLCRRRCDLQSYIMSRLTEWIRGVRSESEEKKLTEKVLKTMMSEGSLFNHPLQEPIVIDTIKELDDQLFTENNHLERLISLDICFPQTVFVRLDKMVRWLTKSDFIAISLAKKSYSYFNIDLAIRCCNLALTFSPIQSETLQASLYADRAKFLFAKKEWESARIDVVTCISILRKLKGWIPVEQEADMVHSMHERINRKINKYSKKESPEIELQRLYQSHSLFKLHRIPNSKIPSAAKSVAIRSQGVKGRFLVFTQELKAGTTVMVEDPYVSMLANTLGWDLKHCGRCYKESHSLTPCLECVFVSYCSEDCRIEDFRMGHKYECKCLPYLHAICLPPVFILALKAVCKAGPKYMDYLYRQSLYDELDNRNGYDINRFDFAWESYESNSYFQIYNLRSSKNSSKLLNINTWFAYVLVNILDMKTDFFDKFMSRFQRKDFMMFIASTFIRHVNSFRANMMPIWSLPENPKKLKNKCVRGNHAHVDDQPLIFALYAVASLVGHSHNPSVMPVTLANGKLAFVTIRNIKAGDKLTMSFCYKNSAKKARIQFCAGNHEKRVLPSEQKYSDKCLTIEEEINRSLKGNLEFLCPNCPKNIPHVLIQRNYKKLTCPNCEHKFERSDRKKHVQKCLAKVKSAKTLIFDQNPIAAIPILVDCIECFQDTLKSPSKPLMDSQYLLRLAFEAIASTK